MEGLIKDFGLGTGLLIALVISLGYILRWSAKNIVTPLVTTYVDLMKRQIELQDENLKRILSLEKDIDDLTIQVQVVVKTQGSEIIELRKHV